MAENNRANRVLVRSEMSKMSDRWAWTLNNPGEWRPRWSDIGQVAYAIYQVERGENGTEHLQGYVRFDVRKRGSTVKRLFDNEAVHFEAARGDEQANKDYCSKEDTQVQPPVEYGTFDAEAGKQGKRSDLETIRDKIKTGSSIADIADEHPSDFIRYSSGIQNMHAVLAPRPASSREVQLVVLWDLLASGRRTAL